ncbi:MAG: XrtA/PEP-CTERM system TPR-repeat protein PrsT [Gammaproteobacteria bacterium]
MTKRSGLQLARFVAVLALSGLATAACARPDPHAAAVYEDAAARYASGDYQGALVQLRNALQKNPDDLSARILAGRTQVRLGDGVAAEKEFRRALTLGGARAQLLTLLGDALLFQRKYREILATIDIADPTMPGGVEIMTLRGRAYFELGDPDNARKSFEAASRVGRNRVEPLIGLAMVSHAGGRLPEAEDFVDRAISVSARDAEAWYMKGELRYSANDLAGAIEAFGKTIEVAPKHMRARLARAAAYLDRGDNEKAREDAQFVRDAVPADIKSSFLLAQALARLGRNAEASDAYRETTERIPLIKDEALMREPGLLRIAAVVAVMRGDRVKADKYLARFVELRPADSEMRKLAGRVKLSLGETTNAEAALAPALARTPDDSSLLAMLGEANLAQGKYDKAFEFFEAAAKHAPKDMAIRSRMALSRIGAGDAQSALADLKRVVELDPGSLGAGIVLALMQIRSGAIEEARTTLDRLEKRTPANPMLLNLRGALALRTADSAAARKAFEGALEADRQFVPAQYNLAMMDIEAGDFAAATRRLQGLLDQDPKLSVAHVGLAEVAALQGDAKRARDALQKAVAIDPTNVDAQTRLIDLLLRMDDAQAAMRAADEFAVRFPERAEAVERLARAQIALGRRDAAVVNFRRAVRYTAFSARDLLRISEAQIRLQDFEGARWTLEKAVSSDGGEVAQAARTRLDIFTANFDAAQMRADEIREHMPDSALGDILTGEIALRRGRHADAVRAFDAAVAKDGGFEAVRGGYEARMAMGRTGEALGLLERWTAAHPNDLEAERTLALAYTAARKLDTARVAHERLLARLPRDAGLLANLARIYQLQKDPRARATAEKALSLAPDWPVALDTLGWILVTTGDPAGGLLHLRSAASRDDDPLTRYHLAVALNELGRKSEAKAELEALLKASPPDDLARTARTMLSKL